MRPSLLAAAVLVLLGSTPPVSSPDAPLVLRDVTVIDATGAPPARHRVIVIDRGRIAAIAPVRGYRVPRGARVIDGSGKFVIPGLWDMHVHMMSVPMSPLLDGMADAHENRRYFLPLFVAAGITGVRDMSGDLRALRAWRDSIGRGLLVGPRMLVTAGKVGASKPGVDGAPYPIRSDADARETVRALKRQGADFVKLGQRLPREQYAALADECRRQGLPFVGHVARYISHGEASDFGQRSIEHLDGFWLAASRREEELREQLVRTPDWSDRLLIALGLTSAERPHSDLQEEILQSQSSAKERALYALLARNGTWEVPTLSALRDILGVREPEPLEAERRVYLPPRHLDAPARQGPIDTALARQRFATAVRVTGAAHRAGIPIMAGTDLPGADRIPGFALVEELELLVRAGLSPMAALQAATREPARYLGAADSLGTIETGKVADLVLLDADPLADVRNVHRVNGVVLRGRYVGPSELEAMRASVRHLVQGWRVERAARQAARAASLGTRE